MNDFFQKFEKEGKYLLVGQPGKLCSGRGLLRGGLKIGVAKGDPERESSPLL